MTEHCAICGCELHRTANTYARPTVEGRSHATKHHYVAERFFGRTANQKADKTSHAIFNSCPFEHERETGVFCYECHEELIHNPVLLPADIKILAELVKRRGLSESKKSDSREPIAGRIKLLHEAISRGLKEILNDS